VEAEAANSATGIEFSVIVCGRDAAALAAASETWKRAFSAASWEFIGIENPRSLASAYNEGMAKARGRCLVLAHDDVEILNDDLAATLRRRLGEYDLIGVAGTSMLVGGKWALAGDPYLFALVTSPARQGVWETALLGGGGLCASPMQALDGAFMAARAEAARQIGFDAETFDGFHHYDLDFSFRAFRAGLRLAVCRDVLLIHDSAGNFDADWERYRMRFEDKFRGELAPAMPAEEGARGSFRTGSREEIRRLCTPARIEQVVAQIEQANFQLFGAGLQVASIPT
jgi:hypothetical protein